MLRLVRKLNKKKKILHANAHKTFLDKNIARGTGIYYLLLLGIGRASN